MTILIDTSVLVASIVSKDRYHQEAARLLRSLKNDGEEQIVPAPVLNELFYFISRELSYRHAIVSFANAQRLFEIEPLSSADMLRMEAIMIRYTSAELDLSLIHI